LSNKNNVADRDRSPVAALGIHAGEPKVRRMPPPLPHAARRDSARSRGRRTATRPRSQRSEFTLESQRFAACRALAHTLRAGTPRGPGDGEPRPVPGRSARNSRWRAKGSPHAAPSPTRCASGQRAVQGTECARGRPISFVSKHVAPLRSGQTERPAFAAVRKCPRPAGCRPPRRRCSRSSG